MKQQITKTIFTFGLLLMLSVGASSVSAFPICATCKPRISMTAAGPSINPAITPVTDPLRVKEATLTTIPAENDVSVSLLFWVRLSVFFAALI